MAEKRLNKDKIAPKDVLDNIGDSATRNKKKVDALESSLKVLKNTAKTIKGGLTGATTGDTKSLAELNELTKRANTTAKTKLGIDKELLIEKEKLRAANAEQNRNIKEELALAKTQKGSLARIRLESKKLRNEKEKLNLTTKKGQQRLKMINMTLDRNNKILEKNATKLGKQKIAIGKYSKALGGLRRVLGQVGIAFGAMALVRDSFNIIKDFQQAQANLASVLGVNVKEMKALTDQAKELGATTRFTASQVSELQVELAKLGFTQQQIQDMTPATLALAEATGTELANAAAVAGSTLNAFGLEAKDTQRVVDVMAKSFSSSSLDMEKFKVAMGSVAPIAKTMGFSIEQTTAMIGALTDSGLDASTAGTSLRNMMLEASKQGLTWKQALDKVNNSTDKAGTALELFGKRGVAAGVILAENQDKVAGLTEKLKDAEGAAQAMADTQRNTLGGALDLLRSAWEGLVLSMDEAGGVGEKLRNGIVFLSKNLGTILKVIGKVVKVLLAYKIALTALKLRDKIKDQIAYNKSLKASGSSAKGATAGANSFGKALKGIGLSVAISVLMEMALAFWDIASGAKAARDAAARFRRQEADADKIASQRISDRAKLLSKSIALQQRLLDKGKITNKVFLERVEALTKANEEAIRSDIKLVNTRKQRLKDEVATLKIIQTRKESNRELSDEQIKTLKKMNLLFKDSAGNLTTTVKRRDLRRTIAELDAEIGGANVKLTQYNAELGDAIETTLDAATATEVGTKATKESTKSIKNLNTVLAEQNEILSRQLELLQELDQLELAQDVRDIQGQIDEAFANTAKLARETGELDVDEIEALVAKKTEILKQAALERQEFEIATIIETNRIESEEALQKLKDDRDKLLAQEGLSPEQIEDIEAQHQENLAQLELNELQRAADLELEILVIKGNTKSEIIDIKEAENDELNALNDELIAAQIEGIEKLNEKKKDELAEEKKRQEDLRDLIEKFGEEVLDGMIKRSKEKQSLLDDEISKQQELADALRQGAMEGNAIATESLAALESSIESKERAKIEEAEREENIERAKAAWNALNNFMDQGDSFPVASLKSISAVSVFESIVGKIKGFFTGTTGRLGDEDTAVRSGKDGHLIWADSDEMIFNGGQVDQAEASGMNTTDDIIKSAVMFHQLKGINAENHVHNMTVDTSKLEAKVDNLTKVMKNKKEITFSKNIQQGLADGIVRTEKQGSMTNRFIIHGK